MSEAKLSHVNIESYDYSLCESGAIALTALAIAPHKVTPKVVSPRQTHLSEQLAA